MVLIESLPEALPGPFRRAGLITQLWLITGLRTPSPVVGGGVGLAVLRASPCAILC